jgi:hypothetical protein
MDPHPQPETDRGSAEPALGPALSAAERTAVLDRAIKNLTREARASLESKTDFEAVLVRGKPVNHVFHFVVLVCLFALLSTVGRFVISGALGLAAALAVVAAYGLFWLSLELTGGVERDVIAVDEQGRLTSSKSGRSVETRGNVLRVAIPGAVILIGLFVGSNLIHDIAFSPPPKCNTSGPHAQGSDPCLQLPDFANLTGASPTSAEPGDNTGSTTSPAGSAFTVDQTKGLERLVRGFLLIIDTFFVLAAAWFMRRMLNGKGLLWIDPIKRARR